MKTLRCCLAVLLALTLLPVCLASPAPRRSLLDRRLVWAHSMICFPLELKWLPGGHYSELYPLEQELGLEQRTGKHWQATDIRAAKAAGVDGFTIDIFNSAGGANDYLEAADQVGGFLIAPCLDLSTSRDQEADAFKTVDEYCRLAALHASAARVGDAYLVYTYGTEQMPVEAWRRVRDRLAAAGDRTYWVVSVDTDGKLVRPASFPAQAIAPWFGPFEAGYCFGTPGPWWHDIVSLFAAHHQPFMGGMMPGYFREGGGYTDAEATALYRREWHEHLASRPRWATISTWNDFAENTGLIPSADWNWTRADLTRWFSAKFKGRPAPWKTPRLYVTTPKTVYPGAPAPAEALVLNPLPRPVRATVQLFDGTRRPFGPPVTVTVRAGQDGAATVPIKIGNFPPGRFLRAHATVRDGSRTLTSAVSAPILVLDPEAQPGYHTVYYSIPADRVLPAPVGPVRVAGALRAASASLAVPGDLRPRFAEALFNTALIKNVFGGRSFSVAVPQLTDTGAIVGGTEWGFYVARVTDDRFRVGYSDPVYVAPHGDLSIKEKYAFDGRTGDRIVDASPFHKGGQPVDVDWSRPGPSGRPSCAHFNGRSSRINLSVGQTPDGPLSLTMTIRPAAWGGVLYCDAGGLIVEINPAGRVRFTRLTQPGSRWVTAEGQTPLKIGEWVQIACTWDGHTNRIFVNGRLDGAAACGAGFESWVRAIGCNPYGAGSAFYSGDISDVEMRALPRSAAESGGGPHAPQRAVCRTNRAFRTSTAPGPGNERRA